MIFSRETVTSQTLRNLPPGSNEPAINCLRRYPQNRRYSLIRQIVVIPQDYYLSLGRPKPPDGPTDCIGSLLPVVLILSTLLRADGSAFALRPEHTFRHVSANPGQPRAELARTSQSRQIPARYRKDLLGSVFRKVDVMQHRIRHRYHRAVIPLIQGPETGQMAVLCSFDYLCFRLLSHRICCHSHASLISASTI
jgi:hypothetical protein